jgi:hypothetical protein
VHAHASEGNEEEEEREMQVGGPSLARYIFMVAMIDVVSVILRG